MAFCEVNDKKYFDERLINFLKHEEYILVLHLIEKIPPNKLVDCHGTTLLHLAAKYNNVCIMRYLIDRGCKINVINKCSMTPLIMAVMSESIEAVKILLNANDNIYRPYFHGNSALKVALGLRKTPRSLSILKLFFKKVTNDCTDHVEIAEELKKANCPLYRVIYLNNAQVTKIMIEHKRDCVNAHDPDTGDTALHEAVKQSDLNNMLVLLDSGADITLRNRKGDLAFVHTFSHNTDILRALLNTDTVWTEPDDLDNEAMKLCQIFGKGNKETVQLFLEHFDVDFKMRDAFERTPLHYLVENDNSGVLELFDKADFDLDARDKGNYAALHYAANRGDPNTVKFLLEKGAHVNVRGYLGCTPLFYAITHPTFESERKRQCVELLMLHGADAEFAKDEETIIGIAQRIRTHRLIEPVIAHFALMNHMGKLISDKIRRDIDTHPPTKLYYEICQREIERMTEDKIYGPLATCTFLTLREDHLYRYVRLPEVINRFKQNEFYCNSYYEQLLNRRFNKAVEIYRLRKVAAQIVSHIIPLFHVDHIIIERIVRFLNYEDLKTLAWNFNK